MGAGVIVSDIVWTDVVSDTGSALTRDFLSRHDGGEVPGALWLPADARPKALILVGHGADPATNAKSRPLNLSQKPWNKTVLLPPPPTGLCMVPGGVIGRRSPAIYPERFSRPLEIPRERCCQDARRLAGVAYDVAE